MITVPLERHSKRFGGDQSPPFFCLDSEQNSSALGGFDDPFLLNARIRLDRKT
ncbi:hypothetical protein SynBMKMC1_02251 [Synechococcus sp. BMK-MC-1]|nr:hypothetical protein SynBMKMC1_02251 [Synechococcus sp. BMK-MC-1]